MQTLYMKKVLQSILTEGLRSIKEGVETNSNTPLIDFILSLNYQPNETACKIWQERLNIFEKFEKDNPTEPLLYNSTSNEELITDLKNKIMTFSGELYAKEQLLKDSFATLKRKIITFELPYQRMMINADFSTEMIRNVMGNQLIPVDETGKPLFVYNDFFTQCTQNHDFHYHEADAVVNLQRTLKDYDSRILEECDEFFDDCLRNEYGVIVLISDKDSILTNSFGIACI